MTQDRILEDFLWGGSADKSVRGTLWLWLEDISGSTWRKEEGVCVCAGQLGFECVRHSPSSEECLATPPATIPPSAPESGQGRRVR